MEAWHEGACAQRSGSAWGSSCFRDPYWTAAGLSPLVTVWPKFPKDKAIQIIYLNHPCWWKREGSIAKGHADAPIPSRKEKWTNSTGTTAFVIHFCAQRRVCFLPKHYLLFDKVAYFSLPKQGLVFSYLLLADRVPCTSFILLTLSVLRWCSAFQVTDSHLHWLCWSLSQGSGLRCSGTASQSLSGTTGGNEGSRGTESSGDSGGNGYTTCYHFHQPRLPAAFWQNA